MAVNAAFEDERRRRARLLAEDMNKGASQISGGVAAFDKSQQDAEKLAREVARADLVEGRAAAGEERAANVEDRAAQTFTANILRQKQVDADAAESEAQILRKRVADEAAADKERKGAAAESKAAAGMQRGLSRADLEAQAAEAGITADELLLRADLAEGERRSKASEGVLRQKKLESEIAENDRSQQPKPILVPKGPKGPAPTLKGPPGATLPPKKKDLPADQLADLAQAQRGLKQIAKVRELKKTTGTGPIESRIKDAFDVVNPFSTGERDQFNAAAAQLTQIVGSLLEGGKMAEGDAKRYIKMLADPNMDDRAFDLILNDMEDSMNDLVSSQSSALGEAYNVPENLKRGTSPSLPPRAKSSAELAAIPADAASDDDLEAMANQ